MYNSFLSHVQSFTVWSLEDELHYVHTSLNKSCLTIDCTFLQQHKVIETFVIDSVPVKLHHSQAKTIFRPDQEVFWCG